MSTTDTPSTDVGKVTPAVAIMTALSLTDAALADRLHKVLDEPRSWSASERNAFIAEAARRLVDGLKADTLEGSDPITRARQAGYLAEQATARATELSRERAKAIRDACAAPGASQTGVAAALGITRGMVGKILARTT